MDDKVKFSGQDTSTMGCNCCKFFSKKFGSRRFFMGVIVLLLVVILWVGSAELTKVKESTMKVTCDIVCNYEIYTIYFELCVLYNSILICIRIQYL